MSGGSKAPAGYQPTQQAQADQGYMSNVSSLAQGGQQIVNQAIPGYQSLYNNVSNNPYYAGAQQGAQTAADAGQAYQQNNAQMAQSLGGFAQPLQGYQQNLGAFGSGIQGYANQISQTAFDPQQALYQQQYQQQMDQQNAINAMYGVAGSPYGAGVAGQTANNFNLNWQNAQLGRQVQGASALSQLGSTMDNAYQTAAGMGTTAAGIYGAASGLNQSGIDVGYQTSQMPNAGFLQQQAAQQAALDALVSGSSGAYGLTQNAIGDYGNYLKIGQSATANAQNATQMNNANAQAGLAGLGKLAGAGLSYFGNPFGANDTSTLTGG